MKTYRGTREAKGGATKVVVEDGEGSPPRPLAARCDLRNHSPSGLEWGYAGSGPAQLALALLADHFGSDPGGERLACALYQDFKFAVVAGLPRAGWTLTGEEIGQMLCRLASEDEARFWDRIVGALDAELFQALIEESGRDPEPGELQRRVGEIITRGFPVSGDYARRRVAAYYAREEQP